MIYIFIIIVICLSLGVYSSGCQTSNEIRYRKILRNIPLMTIGSKWIKWPIDEFYKYSSDPKFGWAIIKDIKQNQYGNWFVKFDMYNKLGSLEYFEFECPVTQFFDIFRYKA